MTQVESGQGMSQTTKIALGALAILAMAAGLWWYFSNMRAADTGTDTAVVEPIGANGGEIVAPPSEVAPMPSLGSGSDTANLGTANEDGGAELGLVGGINPDTPLAGVPSKNPFSPLRIENDDNGAFGGSMNDFVSMGSYTDDSPSFTSSAPVTVPSGTSSGQSGWDFDTPSNSSSSSGTSGSQMSDDSSSWDFEDGALAGTAGGNPSTSSSGGATTDWTFDDSTAGAASAPKPVVAGLGQQSQQLPSSLGGTTPTSTASTGGLLAAGQPSGGSDLGADQSDLPSYVQQYGAVSVAAPDDGTQLSRTLNMQDYRFTGSVIGPNSTAIFKSVQGFDVVEEGDTLPGTNVVVRKIEKQRVVLALGTDTVTLDLESLAKF